jgi:hypothetical protein
MFPRELDVFASTDEPSWIIKLKVGGAKGVICRHEQNPEQPTSFFCAISLLLEGTNIEDCACDHDVYPFPEGTTDLLDASFKVELQRSTELRTAVLGGQDNLDDRRSAHSSEDTSDDEDFQLFGPGMPQMTPSPATKFARNDDVERCGGLTVYWGEEFCLGVSHPDISPDEDKSEGLSDHLELRPRLVGEPLLLLVTLHCIDGSGRIDNLGQVLDPSVFHHVAVFSPRSS